MQAEGEADTLAAKADAEADRARALVRSRLFGEGAATIGRYEIVDRLGSGAMGIVYRAHDPALDRPVALKVLQTAASRTSAARLKVEARALAQLSHPNVVQVYEVGEEEGRGFVAMELVNGEDLAKRLAKARASPAQVARLFLQLGEGLAAAHAVNVLHRDFKPANVLVGTDGRPRIVDFGLARAPQASPGDLPEDGDALTLSGSIVGTPAYLAPELWGGGNATPASDQWAYCIAFYEALFGERPFQGATVPALARRITAGERAPEPPGHQVPGWLVDVVRRGLSSNPGARFPDMNSLVASVRSGLARGRRRRALAGVGVAAGVAVCIGIVLPAEAPRGCDNVDAEAQAMWGEGRQQDVAAALKRAGLSDPRVATGRAAEAAAEHAEQWAVAYAEACAREGGDLDSAVACLGRARARFVSVLSGFSRIDADPEVAYAAVDALGDLPDPTTCLDPPRFPPPADEERAARIRSLIDRAQVLRSGRSVAAALPLAEDAATEAEHPPLRAEALALYGAALLRSERLDEAEPMLERAWALATELGHDEVATEAAVQLVMLHGSNRRRFEVAQRWERHARVHAGAQMWRVERALALSLESQGEYGRAFVAMRTALEGAEAQLGPSHPQAVATLVALLDLAVDAGDDAEASRLLAVARTRVAALGPDHPLHVPLHTHAAQHFIRTDRFEEAIEEIDRAVETLSVIAPERAGRRADLEGTAAVALGLAGELAASRVRFERALELYVQAFGPDDVKVARVQRNLAIHAIRGGDLREAIQLAQRAVTIFDGALGSEANETATTRSTLGEVYIHAREYAKAVAELEAAVKVQTANQGADHYVTVITRINLAQAVIMNGDYEAGRAAVEILIGELGDEHPKACFLHAQAANAFENEGRLAEAERRYRRAIPICAKASTDDRANLRYGLAHVLLGRQRYAEAMAEAKEAAHLWEDREAHAAMARGAWAKARYQQRGGRAEAVRVAQAARTVLADSGRPTDDLDAWIEAHP